MREILHAIAVAVVLTVAAACMLAQVSEVEYAVDHLGTGERPVVEQVSNPGHGRR